MNITKKEIDQLTFTLLVELTPADYDEKVDKQLHKMRQRVTMPGFRPGMVPFGMVKKMYRRSVMAEVINDVLQDAVTGYIKDNDLNVLGEPMPNNEDSHANFETEDTFVFAYDMAVAPEFNAKFTQKDKLPAYSIEVTDEMTDKQIDSIRQRFGYSVVAEEVQDNDLVKGTLVELEDKSIKMGGLLKENAIMSPSRMKDTQKKLFMGKKEGQKIVFNPKKAFGNDAEIASLLGIKKEEAAEMKSDFSFELKEITRFEPAEINQELFDGMFGAGAVKDEAEFRQRVKDDLKLQFRQDEQYRFLVDVRNAVLKKMNKVELPDEFMKRWVLSTNDKMTQEELDRDYPKMVEELKWHLGKEQIAKEHELKVETGEIQAAARDALRQQFAQYGIMGVDDATLDKYAEEQLQKQEQVRAFYDRVMEDKVLQAVRTDAKLEEKSISLDEFNKLFEAEAKK